MGIGWSPAARRIGNAADAFTRLNDCPANRWAVLETGLPDVERGTTGIVNRQPLLLTAAGRYWQATCRSVAPWSHTNLAPVGKLK